MVDSTQPPHARRSVLVLAKGFPPTTGGVEQYSQQIVSAYLRAGFDVTVMTQTVGQRGWSSVTTVDGSYELWNAGPGSQPVVFAKMALTAIRLRRMARPTFVHSTTWRVGIVAAILFRRAVNVVTVHGREVLNYPRYMKWPMKRVLMGADLVIAVSEATKTMALEAIGGDHSHWIAQHNGLSYRDLASQYARPPRAEGLRILSLSRLVPRKNVDVAIKTVGSLLTSSHSQIQLRVAGLGPERARLESLVDELALSQHVDFLGYVDDNDVPELYKWADVFLHPHTHIGEGNDFEGFGLVIADAMSFGCVAIIGDEGGPRELVENHVDGIRVNGSDVDAVVNEVSKLLDNDGRLENLGANARTSALAKFSWDEHVRPAIELFGHRRAIEGSKK